MIHFQLVQWTQLQPPSNRCLYLQYLSYSPQISAKNVKLIYDLYLSGQSVVGIIKELEKRKILSPTGKEKWCKTTIDVMLSNDKYTRDVRLLKSGKSDQIAACICSI